MIEEKQIIEEMAITICRKRHACSLKDGENCRKCEQHERCLYQDIAYALYQEDYRKQRESTMSQVKQSEWISVEDRLPEDDGSTVLYYDGEEVDACYFFFGTFNTMDTYESSEIYGVTHWMPLPEAPKMKGDSDK